MSDATASVQAFANRETTPTELLHACLDRIDQFDEVVNAFNFVRPREALTTEAEQASERYDCGEPLSPLDGIPFAVKANIAMRGCPWHAGIGALSTQVAAGDARAVAMLRSAGMIPIGILNMHEAALGITTDNPHFGRTRNPHNLAHIPGGSSGGSAAAVAAGMVPIALGTDDMGSVRLPSAFCGIVGYKPGHGTIPVEGLIELSARLDHIGVHALSVRDVDAVMTLFCEEASNSAPACTKWQIGSSLAAAVGSAFERIDCVDSLDWRQVNLSAWRRAGLLLCERDALQTFARPLRESPQGFSDEFRAMLEWAREAPNEKFTRAESLVDEASAQLRSDLAGRLLLSPTAPIHAPRVGEGAPDDTPNMTLPANFAGVPSISIPMPNAESELPIGLQVTGLQGAEVRACAKSFFPSTASLAPL
ncbi:MAG: amidase [Gammaproteobacteria bacterium]|nr:amidase [Gammaproteobacteria bacterium]